MNFNVSMMNNSFFIPSVAPSSLTRDSKSIKPLGSNSVAKKANGDSKPVEFLRKSNLAPCHKAANAN